MGKVLQLAVLCFGVVASNLSIIYSIASRETMQKVRPATSTTCADEQDHLTQAARQSSASPTSPPQDP
jgi:hypothetical protein